MVPFLHFQWFAHLFVAITDVFRSNPTKFTKKTAAVQCIEYAGGSEVVTHALYENYIGDTLANKTK